MSDQLRPLTNDGVCENLCESRRVLGNVGQVRMQVLINDFCPFVGSKLQSYQLNFNSETFSVFSDENSNRLSYFRAPTEGFRIRDQVEYFDNLIFIDDEVLGSADARVKQRYQDGKTTPDNKWAPFYAWDNDTGLFDTIVPLEAYDIPYIASGDTIASTGDKAKFTYSDISLPKQNSDEKKSVLMPVQSVVGAGKSIHWSLFKRRGVFQGADFFVEIRKLADQSHFDNIPRPFRDNTYAPLDVNLENSRDNSGAHVNAGVVELDVDGNIIGSLEEYDFNKQVYFIIEIGHEHPEHNYFIIIGENSSPTFIHVGRVRQLIKKTSGTNPYKVVLPKSKVSRRLSTYGGASGKALLDQDITRLRVYNHMGRIVITFDGYEDNPWIIERRDLQLAPGGNFDTDPSNFQEVAVPMVVPGGKLAIHAGNRKMGFLWGYLKYLPEVNFPIGSSINVVGVNDATPSTRNTFVRLYKNNILDLFYGAPADDAVYNQCAHKVIQHEGGRDKKDLRRAQPAAFAAWGKGRSTSGARGSVPGRKSATIIANIYGNSVSPINGEPRSAAYNVNITLKAGSWRVSGDPDWGDGGSLTFNNVITPVCTGCTTGMIPQGSAFPIRARDVSHLVLNYTDNWAAQDYTKVDHSASIKFLLNDGMDNYSNPAGGAPLGDTQFLIDHHDADMFVTVKAWYEGSGVFDSGTTFNRRGGYVPTDNGPNSIIFRGFMHGGDISYGVNERIMECKIHDFSKVLEDQVFLNSPFFDSVRDVAAVHDILSMAGFKGGSGAQLASRNRVLPGAFAHQARRRARNSGSTLSVSYYNGGVSSRAFVTPFALPGSYARLTDPKFKFDDGSAFSDGLNRIATAAGKAYYFDRFGTMHYEDRTDLLLFTGGISESFVDTMIQEEFWVSPRDAPNTQNGANSQCYPMGNLAYNQYTWKRLVGDVYNQLNVVTATPEGAFISAGDTNFDSIDDPDSSGFLGYFRQLIQMSGVYGSEDAVKSYLNQSTAFYKPALAVSFETFGRAHLKALDIIGFHGMFPENQLGILSSGAAPLRITSISSEIDPNNNRWWSRIEGEWIFQGDGGIPFAT